MFTGYVAVLLLSYVYVYLLFQIVNYVFSLVYEVPARALYWIGVQPDGTSPKETLGILTSEVKEMFGKFAESGASTAQEGTSRMQG